MEAWQLYGDSQVNVTDFTVFIGAYGSAIGDHRYSPCADFNSNAYINVTDFSIFAAEYGQPCFPSLQAGELSGEEVNGGCACACFGDIAQLDGTGCDGFRGVTDFSRLAASYYKMAGDPGYNICADLDGNGFVNVTDFVLFVAVYETPCPGACCVDGDCVATTYWRECVEDLGV
jgi:hypothetical protein